MHQLIMSARLNAGSSNRECRPDIPLATLHRRNLPSSITPPANMDGSSSREPLLSPASSSDGDIDDEQRPLYGAVAAKDDSVVRVRPVDAESGEQDGVQQADAINLVWSKAALLLAYCL